MILYLLILIVDVQESLTIYIGRSRWLQSWPAIFRAQVKSTNRRLFFFWSNKSETWYTLSMSTILMTSGSRTLIFPQGSYFLAPAPRWPSPYVRTGPVCPRARTSKPTWAATRARLDTRLLLAAGSRRSPHGDAGTSSFARRTARARRFRLEP
jgi:hypothetical protein